MSRKLKGLAGALIVLALGATSAPGVFAHEFTSAAAKTIITGGQELGNPWRLKLGAAAFGCDAKNLKGTSVGTQVDATTFVPTASGCEFGPFGAASVNVNHCATVFDSDTDAHGHATVDIECASNHAIEYIAPGCTVTVGAQTGLKGVNFTNFGSGEITIKTTVKNMAYTKAGLACFLVSGEMSMEGGFALRGSNDTGSPQANPTTPSTTSEGATASISVS